MSHTPPLLLTLGLVMSVAAAPDPNPAQPKPRSISVSGCAVGVVQPDALLWTVTRETPGNTLVEAKEANEQQVKVLLDACSKKGIQGADVSLGMIKVKDAQVPGQEASDASSRRFLVSRTITLRQRDVGLFQDMLDLLGKGSGQVKYTTYCSKSDKITRDTLIRATQAAKEKAAAMATALGATLGPVLSVNEYPPKGENIPENNVVTDESSGAFGAEAEKVRITVFATFELQ